LEERIECLEHPVARPQAGWLRAGLA
jgi:hypothetical protein